ncbi:MAG: hypothetical protein ACJAYU_003070 [Bradymonadia bacterium]|jgi:hypothetical protein
MTVSVTPRVFIFSLAVLLAACSGDTLTEPAAEFDIGLTDIADEPDTIGTVIETDIRRDDETAADAPGVLPDTEPDVLLDTEPEAAPDAEPDTPPEADADEDVAPLACPSRPGRSPSVDVVGNQILIDGEALHWKGVAWSPIPLGSGPDGSSAHFARAVEQDSLLMQEAGINAVRTYGPITDRAVLDALWSRGIGVVMTVFYGYSDTPESAVAHVCALKDHPAILGWAVGNEWNLNLLGRGGSFEAAVSAVDEVADAIAAVDDTRPIITVYGGLPSQELIERFDTVELWGLNYYSGWSFNSAFSDWESRSDAPFFFAEYGADAYNGVEGRVDETTQADMLGALTAEINANSASEAAGSCVGGFAFEFNDEWWKTDGGGWGEHDTAASWNNGAYPDPGMHEEWWGMVDIDRVPREAYYRYADGGGTVAPSLGSVTLCVDTNGSEYPNLDYAGVTINGNWADWSGWGVETADDDGDGVFCGTVEGLPVGGYEYVHAVSGEADSWSGWGQSSGPPPGSECDVVPDPEFNNFGFRITPGSDETICNRWGECGGC